MSQTCQELSGTQLPGHKTGIQTRSAGFGLSPATGEAPRYELFCLLQ